MSFHQAASAATVCIFTVSKELSYKKMKAEAITKGQVCDTAIEKSWRYIYIGFIAIVWHFLSSAPRWNHMTHTTHTAGLWA